MKSWMRVWSKDDDSPMVYGAADMLDMASGRYNVPKGDSPMSVVEVALTRWREKDLQFVSTRFGNIVRDKFCDLLLSYTNEFYGSDVYGGVHLTTSGSLAVEDAIKMSMQIKPGADTVISFTESYHGASFGAGSATGSYRNKYVSRNTKGFFHASNPGEDWRRSIDDIIQLIELRGADSIACIVLEAVNTIHGMLYAPMEFYAQLSKIAAENNICIIADEVLTGFYRTGKRFAFMHFPIVPDMICFSKAVTNGQVPLGGVIVKSDVRKKFSDLDIPVGVGSTYAGYPFGCAVGIEALRFLKNYEFMADERSKLMGQLFMTSGIQFPAVWLGMLACIRMDSSDLAKEVSEELLLDGIIVGQNEGNIIIAPPFTVSEGEMEWFFEKISEKLKKLEK